MFRVMKRTIDQRLHERVAAAARAYILDSESSIIGCNILDLSFSGARLKVPQGCDVKNNVTLRVPSKGIERQIEVVWRSADQIGVIFSMNTLGCDEAIAPPPKESSKPLSLDELRKLALNAVSAEPTTPERAIGRRWLDETRTICLDADAWRSGFEKVKDKVGKCTRIIGKKSAAATDAALSDEASPVAGEAVEARAGRPLQIEAECHQSPQAPAEGRSQINTVVDPGFGGHDDIGESVHQDLHSPDDCAACEDEEMLRALSSYAHQRLYNRRRWDIPLYATALAVAIVSVSAIFFSVWSEGSAGSPADHRADTGAIAEISSIDAPPASANSPPWSDASAIAPATDSPLPQPAGDTGDAFASAASSTDLSTSPGNDLPRPSQSIRPTLIPGAERGAHSADPTSLWFQNAPLAPCSNSAHFVAAQTFEATMASMCEAINQ